MPVLVTVFASLPHPSSLLTSNHERVHILSDPVECPGDAGAHFFFFSIVMPVLILCYMGSEDEWWPQDTPTKEQTWGSGDGLSILSQIAKHTVCSVCSGVFQPNFIFLMTLWDRYWYCLHLRDEETKFQGGTLGGNRLTIWESQCWAHSFWSSTCVLSCWTLMSPGWGLESINIGL